MHTNEAIIRNKFRELRQPLARTSFNGEFVGLSQYGYVLGFAKTMAEAESLTIGYYWDKLKLLLQ